MVGTSEEEKTRSPLEELNEAMSSGTFVQVRRLLNSLHAADVAHLIEASPPKDRHLLWQLVDEEHDGEVLQYLSEDIRAPFLRAMNAQEMASAMEDMDTDDIADLLKQLPERVTRQVLNAMDQQDRQRIEEVLDYPEDSAGGLMNTDTITVRPRVTLDVVLRYLRRHEELPPMTDNIIVVNKDDEFLGLLPIGKILVSDPELTVRELMNTDVDPIPADMSAKAVANLFERHDWVSAPVVDARGRLLGRITIDDVVDVIREEAAHEVMSSAGLRDEEDVFAGVLPSTRRRLVWLGINLVTAFLAAAVVSRFVGTIEKVAALAALMPIVASMGGIAGTQTVTLIIRGIALGQVEWVSARWLLWKEIAVGGLNGLIWAVIVGTVTIVWYGTWKISLIIAAATLINLLCAATVGVIVPLLLKRMRIDPALSAGVILTTFTDCIGFATLLGLGTLFLT